ncbi:DUF1559 domain-containing protein [Planctomycetaceae bacterium SH139]
MSSRWFLPLCAALFVPLPLLAQPAQPDAANESSSTAWTRERAIRELQFYPRDTYLQFVVMQLSTDAREAAQAQRLLPRVANPRQIGVQRNSQVNLYSIFSGSLAVQESLQLDAMTGDQASTGAEPMVQLDNLQGPTVKSHPWEEMLGDRQPAISKLAECVPEDHLFVRFESVSQLLDARALVDRLYAYSMGQANGRIQSTGAMDRIQRQWLMETSALLKPLYDSAFADVAITSSDLFFNEGTDATLIMRLKEPAAARATLNQLLMVQGKQIPSAKLEKGVLLGIPFTHVTTPDRSVHVYAADLLDDLHVRSNSRLAFERILRTILGQPVPGSKIARLSDSTEFRYVRTLMPLGADEENGFVYMSDPFIRNLIGPEKKLTQRNRLICRGRLQTLRHAQLLFLTQHQREATSIEDLRAGNCLGNAEIPMELNCPLGGEYSLLDTQLGCQCSHHGSIESMVPTCEIPLQQIPSSQAAEYEQFVESYSRYWRTFFDPIAIRIQVQPKRYRVETIVLPLINNSIYSSLVSVLGGQPEPLDSLPVPETNIASLSLRLNKYQLLEQMGIARPAPKSGDLAVDLIQPPSPEQVQTADISQALAGIALGLHNHHSAFNRLPPRPELGKDLAADRRLSWRVAILPFLGENALYEKFHHNEPWDSPHNLALAKQIPDVFASGSAELAKQAKTRYVFPKHLRAMYRGAEKGASFREVTDGLSNTIMVVTADDEHAVLWTKPDDLEVSLDQPRAGLFLGAEGKTQFVMGDGGVVSIADDVSDEELAKMITRDGGEILTARPESVSVRSRTRNRRESIFGPDEIIQRLDLDQFLHHGIGNQIAVHLGDGKPLVDFNVSRLAALARGGFGGNGRLLDPEFSMVGLLALSINTPVYVSVPVKDVEIVDSTLEKLDALLATWVRSPESQSSGFIQIEQDSYRFSSPEHDSVRAYAFRFGPITWRFYWARLGNGLYVASTPGLIADLQKAVANHDQQSHAAHDDSAPAHGLVRLRPQHWNMIKPHFQIGWAEAERRACLHNLSPLANAGRALLESQSARPDLAEVEGLAVKLFGGPLKCPTHGLYSLDDKTGHVTCSLHGDARAATQTMGDKPGKVSRFPESLQDVRLELTFLEDGLHAVVHLETK